MLANIYSVSPADTAMWPVRDETDPVRRAWLLPYLITLQSFALLSMSCRGITRLWLEKNNIRPDDLLIILAVVFSLCLTICSCWGVANAGMGLHIWDLPPDDYITSALITWLDFVLALCSTCSTKVSVLLLYRRVFMTSCRKCLEVAMWVAIGAILIFFLTTLLSFCLICDPLWAYWMSASGTWNKSWHCTDAQWLNYLVGIGSVVTDIHSLILPIIAVNYIELHITRQQKLTLYLFLLLGMSVVVAGIGRTFWSVQLGIRADVSWTGTNVLIWCAAETQMAIICACAPSTRLILSAIFDNSNGAGRGRTYRGSSRSQDGFVRSQQVLVDSHDLKSEPRLPEAEKQRARIV